MLIYFGFAENVADHALLVNQKRVAQNALHDVAVHVFFAPSAVLIQDHMRRVFDEWKRQGVFLDKRVMIRLGIGRDADDGNAVLG